MEIIFKISDFPNPGDRDLYNGIQEMNKGDYHEAQKYFEKGSNYDNEYESLFDALLYYTGFGYAKRDPSKWNNPVAQYLIGAMYLQGDKGISAHEKYALKWLSLAVDNNWAAVMLLLAYGYRESSQKDDSETEPIEDGIIYLFDDKKFELRLKPEDLLYVEFKLDHLVFPPSFYLDPSKRSIRPGLGNIPDAAIWSFFTNRKSPVVISSQLFLGILYKKGSISTVRDPQKHIYLLKKAAKNRSGVACLALGSEYESEKDVMQNCEEALRWYKRALELDHGDSESEYRHKSAFSIGGIYYTGKGVERDCKTALEYFKLRVFKNDHGRSYLLMGDIYEKGKDGVPHDYVLARQYYEKAFDFGEVQGAFILSKFYMVGLGVIKDQNKAGEWMSKAIAMDPTLQPTPSGLRDFNRMLNY